MEELFKYKFLGWTTFFILMVIGVGITLFLRQMYHFSGKEYRKSLRYHIIMYLLITMAIVLFVLVRPFIHGLLVFIILGVLNKNILHYSKAIFSLYFSGIKVGDRIKIGDSSGIFMGINYGGIHLLSHHHKVFLPFNYWVSDKILLESQEGRVTVYIECQDIDDRPVKKKLEDIEKLLFDFPFLDFAEFVLDASEKVFRITGGVTNAKHKESLMTLITKNGFKINKHS